MIKKIRNHYSTTTIKKLGAALLQMRSKCGFSVIPEDYYRWYDMAGVSREAFGKSVRTFDNFLMFYKENLLEDLIVYLERIASDCTMNDGLIMLMRYCTVKSKFEERRTEELQRQQDIKLLLYYYDTDVWMEVMEPLIPIAKTEYPFLEDAARDEVFRKWAAICRLYFREWADYEMCEELASDYRKLMMLFYRQIFGSARGLMFIRNELSEKIEKYEIGKLEEFFGDIERPE